MVPLSSRDPVVRHQCGGYDVVGGKLVAEGRIEHESAGCVCFCLELVFHYGIAELVIAVGFVDEMVAIVVDVDVVRSAHVEYGLD